MRFLEPSKIRVVEHSREQVFSRLSRFPQQSCYVLSRLRLLPLMSTDKLRLGGPLQCAILKAAADLVVPKSSAIIKVVGGRSWLRICDMAVNGEIEQDDSSANSSFFDFHNKSSGSFDGRRRDLLQSTAHCALIEGGSWFLSLIGDRDMRCLIVHTHPRPWQPVVCVRIQLMQTSGAVMLKGRSAFDRLIDEASSLRKDLVIGLQCHDVVMGLNLKRTATCHTLTTTQHRVREHRAGRSLS
ncbi:hypothetical protein KC349_g6 [Hortaea werneckii]|nr:hypothetical protein KC349_g6 [Hortaea werneckii]